MACSVIPNAREYGCTLYGAYTKYQNQLQLDRSNSRAVIYVSLAAGPLPFAKPLDVRAEPRIFARRP